MHSCHLSHLHSWVHTWESKIWIKVENPRSIILILKFRIQEWSLWYSVITILGSLSLKVNHNLGIYDVEYESWIITLLKYHDHRFSHLFPDYCLFLNGPVVHSSSFFTVLCGIFFTGYADIVSQNTLSLDAWLLVLEIAYFVTFFSHPKCLYSISKAISVLHCDIYFIALVLIF